MPCGKCESDNREGRKFCAKCGGPLVRSGPKCGATNEPGEDFCGECAAPKAPAVTSAMRLALGRIGDNRAAEPEIVVTFGWPPA